MTIQTIRSTRDDRVAAGIRIASGILFVLTGVMKLAVPTLGAAFAGQLAGTNIPFQDLQRWIVPFVEVGVGCALLVGYFTRVATLLVLNMMVVATYVHLASSQRSVSLPAPTRGTDHPS